MSEEANSPDIVLRIHAVVTFRGDDADEIFRKAAEFREALAQIGFKWEVAPDLHGTINGKPLDLTSALQASPEPPQTEIAASILKLGEAPPMSFEQAKVVLFPHLNTPGYLQQALLELENLPVTKAIKKASAEYLRKAASDFQARDRERLKG